MILRRPYPSGAGRRIFSADAGVLMTEISALVALLWAFLRWIQGSARTESRIGIRDVFCSVPRRRHVPRMDELRRSHEAAGKHAVYVGYPRTKNVHPFPGGRINHCP